MTCAQFVESRVLEAYDEAAGRPWERHLASCESCASEAEGFQEVRRVYAQARPVPLNGRTKRAIVSMIRRERNRGRLRSAVAGMAGIAAAALLFAGVGAAPLEVAAAEPAPKGSTIDRGLLEIHERLADLETEDRSYFDATLDDLKNRVGTLSWDAENM
jgi:anti-sigma factor RsiW